MRILNGNMYMDDGMASPQAADCGFTPEGEETFTFGLPQGYIVQAHLEANNSTSVSLYDGSGSRVLFWNSGTFIACSLLGAGVGLMVGTFAMNPGVGLLAQRLTSFGCSKMVNRTYEDGDEYVPPC